MERDGEGMAMRTATRISGGEGSGGGWDGGVFEDEGCG